MDPRNYRFSFVILGIVVATVLHEGCTAVTTDTLATRPPAGQLTVLPVDTPTPTAPAWRAWPG